MAGARAAGARGHGNTCHDGCASYRAARGGATSGHGVPGQDQAGGPGAEPDARFTLANERTFLAWNRTALALVVAGLGVVQLLPPFPGVPWGRHVLGVPLIAFGAVVGVAAYWELRRNQTAMRRGQPLPRSLLPKVLAGVITGIAVLAAVVLLVSAVQ
jgi:putative membrane protein